MNEALLLGIDVGTTGTKSMLFSCSGEVLGRSYREYPTAHPQPSYSEQDPEDWWKAIVATVRELCADREVAKRVKAISMSLQGGTVVPCDRTGHALRPALVWSDNRATEEVEEFLKEVGPASLMYESTGWGLDAELPALNLRWLKKHEPDMFQKAELFLTVPDFVALRMTGRAAIDLSDAGINELADIRTAAYNKAILNFAGVREDQLPEILHSGEAVGHLTPAAAAELGLPESVVLVTGAHDQYAVALGAGALAPNDILIGSGTAWVVTALADRPSFEGGLAQSVSAVPGLWGSLKSLSSGGVCLDWFRKFVGGQEEQPLSYDKIASECGSRRAAEEGLFFFPFSGMAGGEKHFNRGTFVGMDQSHDRYALARAIMEGVAFQAVMMLDLFTAKPGPEGLILAGGASRSPLWAQILADISGVPVRIPAVADLACVGAAVLAGTGAGLFSSVQEGYKALAVKEQKVLPEADKQAMYQQAFAEYRRVAQALGETYRLS